MDENYNGKLLFPMKDFLLCDIWYRLSLNLSYVKQILKIKNIIGFRVPQFQLAYISNTTHPSYIKLFKLCREVHYMW